jgi:hypothetical protein
MPAGFQPAWNKGRQNQVSKPHLKDKNWSCPVIYFSLQEVAQQSPGTERTTQSYD